MSDRAETENVHVERLERMEPLGGTVHATSGADGRGGRFDDELLENLVGEWDLTGTVGTRVVRNRVSVNWALLHQFLEMHLEDVAKPSQYEAKVLIGYSHVKGEYVIHWCDNFGGAFSSRGTGARNGSSIEFVFGLPSAPFFNTFTWNPKERTWTLRLENGAPDGTRKPFATQTLRRR